MKRLTTVLCILLLIGVGLSLAPSPAQAQGVSALIGKTIFDVNIRSGPGITSGVIGVLPPGEEATAIGRTSGNNWIQIEYNGTTGWIASWLSVYSGDTALLPVTTGAQPPPAFGNVPFDLYSPYNVNVRSSPDTDASVVFRLPWGERVTATGRNAASSWIRVRDGSTEGWVAAWLVISDGDTNALPVADGFEGDTDDVTPPPDDDEEVDTEEDEGDTDDEEDEETDTDTDDNPPSGGETGITVYSPFRTNVRSAPTIDGTVLDVLAFGQRVDAIGRNEGNNWIQIEYGSTRGWVAVWVTTASEATSHLPVTSDSTEVTDSESDVIVGTSPFEIFLRGSASTSGGQIASLPAGTKVFLISRTDNSDWIKVDYEGTIGWIAAWVLTGSDDFNRLPVEE